MGIKLRNLDPSLKTPVEALVDVVNDETAQAGECIVSDGAGGIEWGASQVGSVEGTAVLSTGETTAGTPLIADGDGSSSWGKIVAASVEADNGLGGNATDGYVLTADGSGNSAFEVPTVAPANIGTDGATNGHFLKNNAGTPEWAAVTAVGIEGTNVLSSDKSTDDKYFLSADGSGGAAWEQVKATGINSNGAASGTALVSDGSNGAAFTKVEGANVASTGEGATNKYLRTDGDNTSSWQQPLGTDVYADNGLGGDAAQYKVLTASDGSGTSSFETVDAGNVSFTSGGNLVETNVGAALDEVEGNLEDHEGETTAAHAASAISITDSGELLNAEEVESALAEIEGNLEDHENESEGAHAATAISFAADGGDLSSTEVNAAIEEVEALIDDHIAETEAAHAATAISYSNVSSGLSATEVNAAIDEVEGRVDALEGAEIKDFGVTATSGQVLIADGVGFSDWDTNAPEGSNVKSTGPEDGTKVLYADGNGGAEWAVPAFTGTFPPNSDYLTVVDDDSPTGVALYVRRSTFSPQFGVFEAANESGKDGFAMLHSATDGIMIQYNASPASDPVYLNKTTGEFEHAGTEVGPLDVYIIGYSGGIIKVGYSATAAADGDALEYDSDGPYITGTLDGNADVDVSYESDKMIRWTVPTGTIAKTP